MPRPICQFWHRAGQELAAEEFDGDVLFSVAFSPFSLSPWHSGELPLADEGGNGKKTAGLEALPVKVAPEGLPPVVLPPLLGANVLSGSGSASAGSPFRETDGFAIAGVERRIVPFLLAASSH
ncbi:MAG: hypothetical protein L3J67_00920 [Hyphomicrobiaceae bacterium]|nr:hypothetical protein [Hyphomicrobiaceae bacterium]